MPLWCSEQPASECAENAAEDIMGLNGLCDVYAGGIHWPPHTCDTDITEPRTHNQERAAHVFSN